MYSESILVGCDVRWKFHIFNLTFFAHIFEGNPNLKNEYPVEIFWSMEKTKKVMYLPLIMQMFSKNVHNYHFSFDIYSLCLKNECCFEALFKICVVLFDLEFMFGNDVVVADNGGADLS